MKRFAQLYAELDSSTKTSVKQQALMRFFQEADDRDKVWTIALFTHRRPKRSVVTTRLREWTADATGLPLWLIEDAYHTVGDLAETLALLNGSEEISESKERDSLDYWIRFLNDLRQLEEDQKKEKVLDAWSGLSSEEQFIFNKLITGGLRVGVSSKSVINALAKLHEEEPSSIALRLTGNWDPFSISYQKLVVEGNADEDESKPYPFYLAYSLEDEPPSLGEPKDWIAEWKWDGIRGQIVKRGGKVFVWSRGEELVSDSFPEFKQLEQSFPDGVVIDGEIICHDGTNPLPFNDLQKRLGRKKPGKSVLENYPVKMIAYDVLEWQGQDVRNASQKERRLLLERLLAELDSPAPLLLSPIVEFEDWETLAKLRETSREQMAEGFMLKHREAIYQVGRKRGHWWKWKVDPMTIDAVMIYAQSGHGRRANLYTDFTFAVWDGDRLVPFAKAYSGLTDKEFREVNQFIRKHTIERFGPVRSVEPELVFELAFEGIAESNRHKSGVALRFPRIQRWRKDKPAKEANSLEDLKSFLPKA